MMKRRFILQFALSLLLLTVTSCHWDVWGSTVIDYGIGNGTISTSLDFTGDAPSYISATKATYKDKIVITWNKVTGADYYEIYRSEDGTNFTRLTTNAIDSTSYSDDDVSAGITYRYKVRARSFSNISLLGAYSEIAYGNTLTPPLSFDATQGESTKEIHLTWSTAENVKGYKIYWSTTGFGGTWQVLIPDGMKVYDYTYSNNIAEGSFVPEKANRGKSIYFYIVSISNSGLVSAESVQRVGYTLVEGAPKAAENFTATRGASPNSITLSWTAMYPGNDTNKSYDWDIYRSADGENEELIYSTQKGDSQPDVADGVMSYTDSSSITAGVEYTYKIIAIGEVTQDDGTTITANGKPSTTKGFLLSPPTEITEKKITSDGFEFVFKDALGAQENAATWSYTVLGRKSIADEWEPLENYKIINIDSSGEYRFTTIYSTTDGIEEHKYEYFSVRTNFGYKSSKRYDEVVDQYGFCVARPNVLEGFNASDNTVYSGTSAKNGLYPVAITFANDTTAVSYDVRVWKSEVKLATAGGYEEITNLTAETLDSKTYIIKLDTTTPVGTKYYFAIRGKDSLEREGSWSAIDTGYSAISGNLLIKYMQIYALKPWEHLDSIYLKTAYPYSYDINTKWKNSAIYGKIKQAGMGSLSSDGITESSYFNNGTIKYTAVTTTLSSGELGGRVSFSYNKFGEVEWMNTTGNFTMNVSMKGNGDVSGALTIKGMYPASIDFKNLSVQSQSFVGTYTVTQTNGLGAEEVSPDQE